MVFEYEIPQGLLPDRPTIGIESLSSKQETPRRDMNIVDVGLICIIPGAVGEREATVEAARALGAEIKSCIRTGDGGGRNQIGGTVNGSGVIGCFSTGTLADPQMQREPKTNTYYGVISEKFTIKIWSTEV